MDLSEIEAELAEIERKESAIDGKIGQLLRDQHNVNDSLSSVFQISKQLTAVDSDVETLHDKLKDTAALSDKISKRVGIEYRKVPKFCPYKHKTTGKMFGMLSPSTLEFYQYTLLEMAKVIKRLCSLSNDFKSLILLESTKRFIEDHLRT